MTSPAHATRFVDDPVPLVDLGWQTRQVADEIEAGFARVIAASSFIGGPDVGAFEDEFASFAEVDHCIGVANGTDAIELSLRAAGVGSGDEVVVPANTFVATAEAVVRAGARPVIADCDDRFLLLNPESMADRVSPATRAVVPVHLFGQFAPVEALADVAEGCVIVEDAAQAQGATRDSHGLGHFARAAATSFYPGKNLGAFGDAGAVLTNDPEIAARLHAFRNHGETAKYQHDSLGWTCRLDTMQAVVLRAKLRRLRAWNELRRQAAARYDALLDGSAVARPETMPGNEHVWHLYVVRVPDRDGVLARLHRAGIGAGIHYPVPVHLQPAFSWLGHRRGDFPVAEAAAHQILSLPIFPGITAAQQERVVDALVTAVSDADGT